MKKIVSITLIAVLMISCFTFAASALNKVNISIEGKNTTFYNGSVYVGANSTVLDVVKAVDDADENLNATIVDSQFGAYISGINGDNEDTVFVPDSEDPEKGTTYYIGWMFAVDNQSSSVGVSAYELKGGEDIVLYYCDMNAQVPVADFSEEGKIKLTSYDWLPDWSGMEWSPVKNAKVTLNDKEYVSDEEGIVTYNPEDFKCVVNMQIERFDELGYPTVCRFPSNYSFKPVDQDSVTLNYKTSLYVKGAYQIDLSAKNVEYTSSNNKVASVSAGGKITANKAGTATVKAVSGNTTVNYKVTVKNPTLNYTKKVLKKGKSFTLKVTGAIGSVKYSTNKKSVASVTSKGKVTAKKKGKAVITAKANGVTLKCNVTVK